MAVAIINDNNEIKINTKWSKWDDCYLTSSPDYPDVLGVGETEKESIECFNELLMYHLEAEKKGKIAKPKRGRPRKNNVRLSANISAEIKGLLDLLAVEKDKNVGLVVEDLVKYYATHNPEATYYLLDSEYQTFLETLRQ